MKESGLPSFRFIPSSSPRSRPLTAVIISFRCGLCARSLFVASCGVSCSRLHLQPLRGYNQSLQTDPFLSTRYRCAWGLGPNPLVWTEHDPQAFGPRVHRQQAIQGLHFQGLVLGLLPFMHEARISWSAISLFLFFFFFFRSWSLFFCCCLEEPK